MDWSLIWVGSLAGGCAGAIMSFLSHIAPRFGAGNFIEDSGLETHAFGKSISRREAHFIGVLLHLVLSIAFGFVFALGVELGYIPGYEYVPILIYSFALALITGLVIMPLEGYGIFGLKHDAWFMVDAVLTNFLWGHLFLVLMRLWLVV
jgi:hypothetical protein